MFWRAFCTGSLDSSENSIVFPPSTGVVRLLNVHFSGDAILAMSAWKCVRHAKKYVRQDSLQMPFWRYPLQQEPFWVRPRSLLKERIWSWNTPVERAWRVDQGQVMHEVDRVRGCRQSIRVPARIHNPIPVPFGRRNAKHYGRRNGQGRKYPHDQPCNTANTLALNFR